MQLLLFSATIFGTLFAACVVSLEMLILTDALDVGPMREVRVVSKHFSSNSLF
jgi:hypothetical protein